MATLSVPHHRSVLLPSPIILVSNARTCATRPFHVSAFVFMPHGDCPSLKFHFRSDNWVLLMSSTTGAVVNGVLDETDLLGTKASVFDANAKTDRRAKSTTVENLELAIVSV